MSPTALVTGAAGFVGSHLSEALVGEGYRVRGLDAFTDYYPRSIKQRNISRLVQQQDFELVEADLMSVDLSSLLQGVDVIFHLAGQPGVRGSWGENFGVYVRNNILATQRLLEAARLSGKPRLIYASSSSVYGNIKEMPLHEEMALSPVSPYGVTKLAGEHLCHLYAGAHSMDILSLRLFTVYGPRQRPEMAFAQFITAMLEGKSISVYGDGKQTRDFTFVGDIVHAFLQAVEHGRAGQAYNIAGGARTSINSVIATLSQLTGCSPQVSRLAPQAGDVQDTWASTDKARSDLAYMPATNLESGLAQQVKSAQEQMAPASADWALRRQEIA